MSANADAATNAQGEFSSRIKPTGGQQTTGHAVGTKIGNDAAPEFHAETLPAGSAPPSRTFAPDTTSTTPGQAMNPNVTKETWTNAESTMTGATSADVHTGIGKPISGQTSSEVNDAGKARGEASGAQAVEGGQASGIAVKGADKEHETGVMAGGFEGADGKGA